MDKAKEYDQEEVYYCENCLSLRIRGVEDQSYCDECSSTDIGVCSIEEWAKIYEESYGPGSVLRHKSIFKAED